ncbi:hypothetical protein C4K04_0244 [Pseudomonas chlororaphis]|uniref:Uncharacterized protein n=1 Tax=Pseudomonas chlororaphis TaxID=587753 RepID=A0A3G7TH47_9PSED|nr:hypothetical protein [Pseudomonas chlororaphis]AZE45948.1 hypothetical protein C4K04_0244 [Pseudomonas chlororaphis]
MKLLALLKDNFTLSEDLNISTKEISNKINEDFSYKNDYTIKKTSQTYSDEVCIQKNIADSSGMQMPGFKELINELKKIPPTATIYMRFIDSSSWSGRFFLMKKIN